MTSAFSYYNRGPITSTFTPPASCLSTTTSSASLGTSTVIWVGHFNDAGDTSCYPPATRPVTTPVDGYYYSPAICPSGWYSACPITSLLGIGRVENATTAAACCPSAFVCVDGVNCGSVISQNTTLSDVYVLTNEPWSSMNFPQIVSVQTVNVTSGQLVVAEVIPILWQSTDTVILDLLAGKTPTSTGAGAPSTATASGPSSTSPAGGSSASGTSGLSNGAKIAIGVSIPVVVLFAILGIFLYFRRRHRSMVKEVGGSDMGSEKDSRAPFIAHEMHGQSRAVELPEDQRAQHGQASGPVAEMDSTVVTPSEMDSMPAKRMPFRTGMESGPNAIYEMAGSSPLPLARLPSPSLSATSRSSPVPRKPVANADVLQRAVSPRIPVSSASPVSAPSISPPTSPPPTYHHLDLPAGQSRDRMGDSSMGSDR